MKEKQSYILDGGGDVQTSGAWSGKLPRVNVGNFPDSSVDVFQVLSLHHQDGLGWVEVELQEGQEGCKQWMVEHNERQLGTGWTSKL